MRRDDKPSRHAPGKAWDFRKNKKHKQKASGRVGCVFFSPSTLPHRQVVTVIVLQSACDRTRVAVFNSTCCYAWLPHRIKKTKPTHKQKPTQTKAYTRQRPTQNKGLHKAKANTKQKPSKNQTTATEAHRRSLRLRRVTSSARRW